MERLSNEQIEAIRKRAEAATDGPWQAEEGDRKRGDRRPAVVCHFDYDHGEWFIHGDISDVEDADFIAHAREDVPALLAEIERLNELNNEIIEMIFGDAIRKSAETLVEEIRKKVGR